MDLNILNDTLEEKQSNIRLQVKGKIRQIQNTKADLPKAIADLKEKISLPVIKEAFGKDLPEIEKIVNSL